MRWPGCARTARRSRDGRRTGAACRSPARPGPTSVRACSMSSRYCRHDEYELYADVTNASARSTPSSRHLAHGVGEERVPVAVAPVHGQGAPRPGQLGIERGDERTVVRVDRAHAAERVVLPGHDAEPILRHVPATRDVLEEREDVVGALGAAERDDHDGVVHRAHRSRARGRTSTHHASPMMPIDFGTAPMLRTGPDLQEHPIAARLPPEPDSRPATVRGNPLPEGTITVGTGLVIAGLASYGFLAISARALGPEAFAPLSVMWIITFLAGPGFFLPVEQEVSRALAHRRGEWPWRRTGDRASRAARRIARRDPRRPLAHHQPVDGRAPLRRQLAAVRGLPARPRRLLRGPSRPRARSRGWAASARTASTWAARAPSAWRSAWRSRRRSRDRRVLRPRGRHPAPHRGRDRVVSRETQPRRTGTPAPWAELTSNLGYLLGRIGLRRVPHQRGPITVAAARDTDQETLAGAFTTSTVIARVPLFLFQAVQASLLPKLAALAGRRASSPTSARASPSAHRCRGSRRRRRRGGFPRRTARGAHPVRSRTTTSGAAT